MSNTFNGTESLGDFSDNYSSNLTAITANISNLSSQLINGGTHYLTYNGNDASPTATFNINYLTNIINNTTTGDNSLVITLPNGLVEGQILCISPANENTKYTITGTNFYVYETSYYTDSYSSLMFVWSSTLQRWCAISQY
jgi:hypothetical protein